MPAHSRHRQQPSRPQGQHFSAWNSRQAAKSAVGSARFGNVRRAAEHSPPRLPLLQPVGRVHRMAGGTQSGAPEGDVWADQGEQWADEQGRCFVIVEARPDSRMQPQSYPSRSAQQGWQRDPTGPAHAHQQHLSMQQVHPQQPHGRGMLPNQHAEDIDEAAEYSLNDGQLQVHGKPYAGQDQGWEAPEQAAHSRGHLRGEQQQQVGGAAGATEQFGGGGRAQQGQRHNRAGQPPTVGGQYGTAGQQGGRWHASGERAADVDEFGVSLDAAAGVFGEGEADAAYMADGQSAAWAEAAPDMAGEGRVLLDCAAHILGRQSMAGADLENYAICKRMILTHTPHTVSRRGGVGRGGAHAAAGSQYSRASRGGKRGL